MAARIIIITLLSSAIAFHVNLHLFDDKAHSAPSQWRQPEILSNDFPRPIDTNKWNVNFFPFEALIQHMPVKQGQQLLVNSTTRELLVRLDTLLPENVSIDEKKRVRFLIMKSLHYPANEQLVELFNRYSQYSEAISNLEQQTSPSMQEKHNKIVQYQVGIFGKLTANKLFADKNLTTQYLLDRQQINQQSTLSPEEKSAALKKLKLVYQQAQANYDR